MRYVFVFNTAKVSPISHALCACILPVGKIQLARSGRNNLNRGNVVYIIIIITII